MKYMGESLQNKLFTYTKKCVTIWIKCLHAHGIGNIQRYINLFYVSSQELSCQHLQWNWSKLKRHTCWNHHVIPTVAKYSLKICHPNTDLHWSHLTCQIFDDHRTRQYIHNHWFQWSLSFGLKTPSTGACFIYMLSGYRAESCHCSNCLICLSI